MSIITSFVNVIAGASILLGGKPFMDDTVSSDGPTLRKVIGAPLLAIGGLGILMSYVRNRKVREDKKSESFESEGGEKGDIICIKCRDSKEELEKIGEFLYFTKDGIICQPCAEDYAIHYDSPYCECDDCYEHKHAESNCEHEWESLGLCGGCEEDLSLCKCSSSNSGARTSMQTCTKCGEIDFDLYSEDEKRLRIDEMWTAESYGAESISKVPTATLGQSTNNPVRIIIGGPPHSGKSTLMSLVEDKMKQYGVSVELRDLDFSSPTDLKGAFDPNRKTIDWTPELAEEAANYFIGLISRINEVVSQPADVAILLVSGSKNDNDQTYRDAIKKWQTYYEFIDMPILMVIRSSMNPEDLNYFDPHDNYGVMVGLDRPTYRRGDISLENTCLEGIVFEIAQEFDLGLANRSAKPHIEAVEAIWPELKGKGTWNPIDAGKPHLGKIEDDYFSTFDERRREKNMN